jgi:hypothetical protein
MQPVSMQRFGKTRFPETDTKEMTENGVFYVIPAEML